MIAKIVSKEIFLSRCTKTELQCMKKLYGTDLFRKFVLRLAKKYNY